MQKLERQTKALIFQNLDKKYIKFHDLQCLELTFKNPWYSRNSMNPVHFILLLPHKHSSFLQEIKSFIIHYDTYNSRKTFWRPSSHIWCPISLIIHYIAVLDQVLSLILRKSRYSFWYYCHVFIKSGLQIVARPMNLPSRLLSISGLKSFSGIEISSRQVSLLISPSSA